MELATEAAVTDRLLEPYRRLDNSNEAHPLGNPFQWRLSGAWGNHKPQDPCKYSLLSIPAAKMDPVAFSGRGADFGIRAG